MSRTRTFKCRKCNYTATLNEGFVVKGTDEYISYHCLECKEIYSDLIPCNSHEFVDLDPVDAYDRAVQGEDGEVEIEEIKEKILSCLHCNSKKIRVLTNRVDIACPRCNTKKMENTRVVYRD